jgi:hypothetical protein
VGEEGVGTVTWGALATIWEILEPEWCQRRGARFRRSDGKLDSGVAMAREGSTASWAGGQNRGGRQNREEYGGNEALTLTKSSSVRITGKPDKVGSASGSRTRFMSSNIFSPIQTLGFRLKQIWPKKDPLNYFRRAFGPAGWLHRKKHLWTCGKELSGRKLISPILAVPRIPQGRSDGLGLGPFFDCFQRYDCFCLTSVWFAFFNTFFLLDALLNLLSSVQFQIWTNKKFENKIKNMNKIWNLRNIRNLTKNKFDRIEI